MSSKFSRKPVAVAALFASSIGSVLVAGGAAHATTFGGAGTNPVTITAGGTINVVGGGTVALPAGAHDVSWAGQGGRFAYIGGDNAIYTADYDGTHIIKVAQGVAPSHTVWDVSSEAVYWTEGTGATAKVVGALANGGSLGSQRPTFDLVSAPVAPAGLGLSNPDVASDQAGSVVVQTNGQAGGAATSGIGLVSYGTNGEPTFTTVVAPDVAAKGGSQPTISADGKTVVFVRTDANGDAQLFATSLQNNAWSAPKQITWMTGDHATPIFEADNQSTADQTVAFEFANRAVPAGSSANGTYQVDVSQALAAAAPAPQLEKSVSALSGGLAVRTDNPGRVYRIAGSDRVDTAVLASRQSWRTNGAAQSDQRAQAKSVVLSRSDVFADALGGAALAAHKSGPLLLTDSKTLNAETLGEIRRVLPTSGTVYILGGTAAVSPAVQSALAKLGYTVDRIAGQDRYDTAVKIANAVDPNASDVLVATGANYPDALSAGAAAGSYSGMVVVLTNGNAMPASTDAYLQAKANSGQLHYVAAVGGAANTALKAAKWHGYDALVGSDRYQTSYLVAHEIFGAFGQIGIATGANWPDSLSGGAMMGFRQGPLLLVNPATGLSAADNALIDANRGASNWGFIYGGTNALPLRVDQQLAADIATSAGSSVGAGNSAAQHLATPNVAKG
ncbi:cell wall-binding repeat-containing protein [Catenulispora sp. NF23]|uniref:Cell wall-binding repeat-containing protein n=1 Tax=Catenulispora pinistramenti TaxID=2705254 RepID=A0ABS5KMT7_9ACTN|nr:cell wall-binding repeat-containing protein [Catenulispora pinistramenti]MBS2531402.1 cell wall-binding repeat-containing protein [Catenulispora pinistramenti]MBS2547334.1 cell wall-binding repeat-containing protein [Catenulispora pinistramenti]